MNKEIEEKIINYLLIYQPEFIGIFGSYARNEQTKESDLDMLVSFKKTLTLIDLSKIRSELSENLKINIDLVTQKDLNPRIKPFIDKDLQIIYREKR